MGLCEKTRCELAKDLAVKLDKKANSIDALSAELDEQDAALARSFRERASIFRTLAVLVREVNVIRSK